MSVTRRELERMLAAERRATTEHIARAIGELEATLRDELHEELVAITRRIDGVHQRALRQATAAIRKRG